MRKYFGTDGVRGVVGEFPITPDFALKLGYAAGRVLGKFGKKPAVVIGKDTRLSGYLFESSLEAGFSYAGISVYMAGPVPTPAVAYLARALKVSLGVVISASHNPYTDNGIKFFSGDGEKLPDHIELEIESLLEKEMVKAEKLGKVVRLEDSRGRYIEFCKSTFPKDLNLDGKRIVLDCANGATYQVAPSVFKELGADVIKLACEPDGVNINYHCGSTHPEALIKKVLETRADFGIAFDGDGDRVLFVDNKGQVYNGDKLLYIIMKGYLADNIKVPGVVGTVMTNIAFENRLKQMNIGFVRAKVGDRYVLEELNNNQWVLGGEASGHLLCLDKHSTGDGIISALQVVATLIRLNVDLSDVVDFEDYPQVMINVRLDENSINWLEKSEATINEVKQKLGDNGRVIVRASGTEPLVRVMVEAANLTTAQENAELIVNKIKS